MAKRKPLFRLQRVWLASRQQQQQHSTKGFTLLELLVVVVIAGGLVSGLMYIVVQLMGVDQRESAQSETQREMQMAMDYMATELRDSVYVYTAQTLGPTGARTGNLTDYLPPALTNNSVPVLAFWKQLPYPDAIRVACAGANPPVGVNCTNGSSYTLVIYSLARNVGGGVWQGKARITRYALTEFNATGALTQGYVNPGLYQNNFNTWPFGNVNGANTMTNIQEMQVATTRQPGIPNNGASIATLVDFVDDSDINALPNNAGQVGACPATYVLTPPDAMLNTGGLKDVRSFYACVSPQQAIAGNQDTVIYLRGSVFGRGNFSATSFLPTLETRVLSRGVLGRIPN
ncbi:MAG: prepilin-type N-terminal cleavage/methylation domain-containing protein [Oculatellaceae cyanobacterium Prado106]|jgi:prepilin-type N-terminal cleavage/methylation domain-containing protein|nr:prepilin-type N-terminal cleavage/methylation domain-containing protein [Oculatellaceae cyanobacterium Prado106]